MHFHLDAATVSSALVALGLMVLDWLMGVITAVAKGGPKAFSLQLLPKQAMTTIPLAGVGFTFSGLLQGITTGGLSTALTVFVATQAATVSAAMLNDIKNKLASISTGQPTTSTAGVLFGGGGLSASSVSRGGGKH